MRSLSDHWVQSFRDGVTTICHCWKIIRKDGAILGFTDHDQDLVIDQILFSGQTGMDSSESESILGLSTTGRELSGVLNSLSLKESDLASGLYDGASVEIWLVDWMAPGNRILLDIGVLGEVTLSESLFSVEVRSLASAFDQVRGRLYQANCSADFGDQNCKLDHSDPRWTFSSEIASVYDQSSIGIALANTPVGYFTNGRIIFQSGHNIHSQFVIKSHICEGNLHILNMWTFAAQPMAQGDRLLVSVGCDKSFKTCQTKFNNSVNYRGFPHMPGNDVLAFYPSHSDMIMDGRSLFK